MEPVEINAGAWYLRALRADEWAADTGYAWAVCEPTTGVPVAEVTADPASAEVSTRGDAEAAAAGAEAVRRFLLHLVAQPGE
jgi:hypothetical protein